MPTTQELLARLRQVKLQLPVLVKVQLPIALQSPPAPTDQGVAAAPAEKGGRG